MTVDPSLTAAPACLDALREAVALSAADETVIGCVETRRHATSTRGSPSRAATVDVIVQVRVIEAGRLGTARAATTMPTDLEVAVRRAMAAARAEPPLAAGITLRPAAGEAELSGLHDPAVAMLTGERAQRLLREGAGAGEVARLEWTETALSVAASTGLAVRLEATAIAAEVRLGGHGAGLAASAARSLAALDLPSVFARARNRGGPGAVTSWSLPPAIVLAPEAMAALVAALGRHGLSAAVWDDPRALGRLHRGEAIFSPALTVLEDGTRSPGLPFPLDTTGGPRRPASLVADGILQGPVADPVEAVRLGVAATRPLPGADDSVPEHLFLLPGGVAEDDLLAAADGGVFVGQLDLVRCWSATGVGLRATARGVQRIARGALAGPLPDLHWQTTLCEALAGVRTLGQQTLTLLGAHPSLGGTSAPSALLAPVGEWREA